jgi:Tol biopolymer transport system component/predicted Ser/Thr protein kinase
VPLSVGTRAGPYEILGPIGEGGMGQVYRARDTRLHRDVAIKVSIQRFSERFEREAHAVAALNHPNICTLHDVGPDYLVMELVDGKPLKGPLSLDEALRYAGQICEALEHEHRKGVTHRDLKPANILVTKQGVKLLDFGLARITPGPEDRTSTQLTQAGAVMGTPAYMAPEQWEGKPADSRSDIYAFGCVLYEMLTGRQATRERKPLAPEALETIVKTCLENDPEDRWQSARDLKRALLLAGTTGESEARPARGRVVWIAGAAVLAAAVFVVWSLRPSPPPAGRVEASRSQIAIPDNGTIAGSRSNTLAVAPDGRKIAMVVERNQNTGVWVRALEESAAHFVPGSDGAQYVLWSPDSKSLAFRVLNKLLRFDLASSAPVVIAPLPIGPTFGADWGDDGTSAGTILFWGAGSVLMRVSGSGGTPVAIGVTEGSHPQLLPGDRFFYTSNATATVFGARFDHSAEPVEILKEDTAPVYAPGFLVWIRGTTLLAQAFDPGTMRLSGEPTVLADPAWTVAVSSSLLLYDPAPAMSQFAWVDRNGKVLQLVGNPAPFGVTAMSPDGKGVAVTVAANAGIPSSPLWMLDTQRGVLNRFVPDLGANTSPAWSPDGQTVLFGTGRGLGRIATNGVGEADIVHPFPRRLNPTDWSRRGFVVFNQFDPDTEMNIMMLPVMPDGTPAGDAAPYLQKPGAQSSAHFSPDGGWVAYEESAESGRSEVFIDTFPERHGAIQISSAGGFGARWNPQGGELFYRSPAGKMMVVSLKMDKNSAEVSTPRELFTLPVSALASNGSQFDVGPDGKRFLIRVSVKKAPLEVIMNWQALLK